MKKIAALFGLVAFSVFDSFSQTGPIVTYDVPTQASDTNARVWPSVNVTTALGVSATPVSMSSVLNPATSSSNGWGAIAWMTNATSRDAALLNTNYFQWSISAGSTYTVTITSISKLRMYQSSTTSSVKNLELLASTNNWTNFVSLGTTTINTTSSGGTSVAAALGTNLATSPIIISNGATVNFRLVAWNGTSASSNIRFTATDVANADFVIDGTSVNNASADLVWSGASGDWNYSATTCWQIGGGSAATFKSGDAASFTNTGSSTATIDSGGVAASSVTVSSPSGTISFAGGALTASLIVKTNSSTLSLGNASVTSPITVNGGTLLIASTNVLGSSALTLNSGTVDLGSVSSTAGIVTVTGGSLTGSGGTISPSGLSISNVSDLSINANIGGSGGLSKAGAGKLTLAGNNSYNGATSFDAACAIEVGSDTAFGNSSGVSLNISGYNLSAIGATRTLQPGFKFAASGGFTGTQALSLIGTNSVSAATRSITNTATAPLTFGNLALSTTTSEWRFTFVGTGSNVVTGWISNSLVAGNGMGVLRMYSDAVIDPGTGATNYPGSLTILGNASMGALTLFKGTIFLKGAGTISDSTIINTVSSSGWIFDISGIDASSETVGNLTLSGTDNQVNLGSKKLVFGGMDYSNAILKFTSGTNRATMSMGLGHPYTNGYIFTGVPGIPDGTTVTGSGSISSGSGDNGLGAFITLSANATINGQTTFKSSTFADNKLEGTFVGVGGVLEKTGNNVVRMQNSNSYSGGTIVSQGFMGYSANNALGTGPVSIKQGAGFGQSASMGTNISQRTFTNALSIEGDVFLGMGDLSGIGGYANHFSGNVDLKGGVRTLNLSNSTTFYGVISNGGLVIDNGSGGGSRTVNLQSSNSFDQGVRMVTSNGNPGILAVGNDGSLGSGTLVFGQVGTLRPVVTSRSLANNLVISNAATAIMDVGTNTVVALDGSGTNVVDSDLNLSGSISGGGALVKTNTGILTLSGSLTYTGGTTVTGGTLIVSRPAFTATITTNTISISYTAAPNLGTNGILPGALIGSYSSNSISITGLGTGQTAEFQTNSGNLIVSSIPAPSGLSYSPSTVIGTVGVAITNLLPSVTGTVTNYSVSPALPSGLGINPTNGVISGTPSGVSASANYTVTAVNGGGSTTAQVTIAVASAGSTFESSYTNGLTEIAPNGLPYLVNYAFGGSQTNNAKLPSQDTSDPAKLTLVAYVRTNDSGVGGVLSVKGQTNNSLSGWSTNTFGPSSIPADQSDAPAGTQKQIFSVTNTGDRLFLRLKVTK